MLEGVTIEQLRTLRAVAEAAAKVEAGVGALDELVTEVASRG